MSIEQLVVKTNCVIWKNIPLSHPQKSHKSPEFYFDGANRHFAVWGYWRERYAGRSEEVWHFTLHSKDSKPSDSYVVIPYVEKTGEYVRLASSISNTDIWRSSLSSILTSNQDIITVLFFFSPNSLSKASDFKEKSVGTLERNYSGEKSLCLEGLSKDIVQLFNKKGYADATLKCGDKWFSVHRNILAVRSSVFSTLFEHDVSSEKHSGVVEMDDLDSNILEQFLLYLYSGKIEQVCMDSAIELYKMAEKYAVPSLKQLCASYILDNMSKDFVCKVLLLADQFRDEKFLDGVASFASENGEFLKSTEWEDFAEKFPTLAIKVYLKYLKRN